MRTKTADWSGVADLIQRASDSCGAHQLYPATDRKASLAEAIGLPEIASSPSEHAVGSKLSDQLNALASQSKMIASIGDCPIVGITGLLNSGKSTLLASYLSPRGRARVLRGTANDQGTHRFVLWLPLAWSQNADLLSVMSSNLRKLFGAKPVLLAKEPKQAFAQYNGESLSTDKSDGDPMTVPLVAFDSALDSLGMALLDCPDIQSSRLGSSMIQDPDEAQQHRRQMLARVGRLCSAFLVVSKLSSLHDDTLVAILDTLRVTMPGVRRILAVNKVKARYSPEVVEEQTRDLVSRFQISDVYMAYDYRSHWAEHRLPPPPEILEIVANDPMPIFFHARKTHGSVSGSSLANLSSNPSTVATQLATLDNCVPTNKTPPAGMQPPVVERYLYDLSKLLPPGSLVIEGRRSILEQLESKTIEACDWFETNQRERQNQLTHAWQSIAEACFTFMADKDPNGRAISLRLQTSPAIIAQMSESLVRAAPWTMRPSLAIDRSVRQLQNSISGSIKRMRWLQSASASVSDFLGRFRQGQTGKIVTADRFREQLERLDRHGSFSDLEPEPLTKACEHALARFQQEDTVRLDNSWLDNWSAQLWKQMSLKRKLYVGMMPLAPVFGPLLAVTLIPFDGGGTAVLVFATTKELLLAAGIAAVVAPTTLGGEVQDIVESEAALSQLGELFAVTCDSLGLPRPDKNQIPQIELSGNRRPLASSQLPIKAPAMKVPISLWQLALNFRKTLQSTISDLRVALEKQEQA